jgi:hypothetical protein
MSNKQEEYINFIWIVAINFLIWLTIFKIMQ